MKLIEQSFEILYFPENPLQLIERAGRTCYKSEDKITPDSASAFAEKLVKIGHWSVIEHASATVRFVTCRSVTHELVRHRLASYSQESTRYVRYDGKMEFILPVWWNTANEAARSIFTDACINAETAYCELLANGWKPQETREVLPNALKTEIVMSCNFREWMHVFELRTSLKAHPQIRDLMRGLHIEFATRCPEIFG